LVVATSDHHVNSTVGLCPPEGVQLDDTGFYKPGAHQLWSWQKWEAFHQTVDAIRTEHKAELVYVVVGDAVDGNHHQTTQIISGNMEVQGYLASRVFSVPQALKPRRFYFVRGTDTHTGPSGSSEEALAKSLQAVRDDATQNWSTWHLRLELNGRLFDFQHHGRIGTRPHTRRSLLTYLANQIWQEHLIAGERVPDFAIRADRHLPGDSGEDAMAPVRVIALPPWQFKTAFGHRVAPENMLWLGGLAILVQPDGESRVYFKSTGRHPTIYHPALPAIQRLP
jgi:hypothetical protein